MKNNKEGSAILANWLSSFSCKYDKDIENFLHNRAVEFELLNKSRTYLVLDDDILRKEERAYIRGFFTIGLKVLDLPGNTSNNKRRMYDGFSAKQNGKIVSSIPCYLIGQFAKNFSAKNAISGAELMDMAISVIKEAVETVGGRYVLIECRDNPHLQRFYTDNGFVEFDRISLSNVTMVQMLRPIYGEIE